MPKLFRQIIATLVLVVVSQNVVTFEDHNEVYFIFDKKHHHHVPHNDDGIEHVWLNIYRTTYKKYFTGTLKSEGHLNALVTKASREIEPRDLG